MVILVRNYKESLDDHGIGSKLLIDREHYEE